MLTVLRLLLLPRVALIAENLFLRKQLALFRERNVRPRRWTNRTRAVMVFLAKFFDWHDALVIVKPEHLSNGTASPFECFGSGNLANWDGHRLPTNVRDLVREMARDNPTWGEERIANELSLKLGIRLSPRTVRKYLSEGATRRR